MRITLLGDIDTITKQMIDGLDKDRNSYNEPQHCEDICICDNEIKTMVSVRITKEKKEWEEYEQFFKAEIIISDNEDVCDDDNVLCSEDTDPERIKELITDVLNWVIKGGLQDYIIE